MPCPFSLPCTRPCATMRNMLFLYGGELLAQHNIQTRGQTAARYPSFLIQNIRSCPRHLQAVSSFRPQDASCHGDKGPRKK
jgi:hypothetical protein